MSTETAIEDILIALLEQDETLAAYGVVSHHDDTQNTEKRIVVSVVKESEVLEGPTGYRYTGTVTIRSNEADAANIGEIAELVDAVLEEPEPDLSEIDTTAFTYLTIEEESGGDRPTDEDTRSRIRTFPIHAA